MLCDALTGMPAEAGPVRMEVGCWRFHGLGGHYEGEYARHEIDQVPAGEWAAPPATFRLPKGGYVSITEADLKRWGLLPVPDWARKPPRAAEPGLFDDE